MKANESEYVLTIGDDKSIEDVINLAGLLGHLAEYGFPISRVVPSEDDEKITQFREKAMMVKKYIPGVTIRHISKGGLYSLGLVLGHLHQIPAPNLIPKTHSYGVNHFDNAYGLDFDAEFENSLAQMGKKN